MAKHLTPIDLTSIPTGTSPLSVSSTTLVSNLNADQLEGYHASINPSASMIPVLDSQSVLNLTGKIYITHTSSDAESLVVYGSTNIDGYYSSTGTGGDVSVKGGDGLSGHTMGNAYIRAGGDGREETYGGGSDTGLVYISNLGGRTLVGTAIDDGTSLLQLRGYQASLKVTDGQYFAADVGGSISFAGKYDTAGDVNTFASISGVKENSSDGNYTGSIVFKTNVTASGLTEKVRITGSGNIKILSPAPCIYNATTASRLLLTGSIDAGATNGGAIVLRELTSSINPNGLELYSGGSERVRLVSSGNFLIGTTSDDGVYKLQVNGGIKSLSGGIISAGLNSSNYSFQSSHFGIRENGSVNTVLECTTGEILYIRSGISTSTGNQIAIGDLYSGNILIGTSTELNAAFKLQVSGGIMASSSVKSLPTSGTALIESISQGADGAFIRAGATGTGLAALYLDSSNGDFSGSDYVCLSQNNDLSCDLNNYSANSIRLRTNGSTRLEVTGGGNVLLGGQTDQGYVLALQQNSTSTGGIYVRNPDTGTTSSIRLILMNSSDSGQFVVYGSAYATSGYANSLNIYMSNPSGNIILSPGAAERARFTSSGHLLLGTTTDNGTDRLQVNGTINASGGITAPDLSQKAFQCSNVTSTPNQYTKIATITIPTQYQECTAKINVGVCGHGAYSVSYKNLYIRIKQQVAFGGDPYIQFAEYYDGLDSDYINFGYVIVQNTPSTIIDVYAYIKIGYGIASGYKEYEYINAGCTLSWLSNQSLSTTQPTGWVASSKSVYMKSDTNGSFIIPGGTPGVYTNDSSSSTNLYLSSSNVYDYSKGATIGLFGNNGTGTGNLRFYTGASGIMTFNIASTEICRAMNNGSFVIGSQVNTNSLGAKLECAGVFVARIGTTATDSIVGTSWCKLISTNNMVDGFGPAKVFSIEDTEGVNHNIAHISGVRTGADNSGSLVFTTYNAGSATEKMRIRPDGNMLIATSSDNSSGSKLQVNGNISASGIKLNGGTTALSYYDEGTWVPELKGESTMGSNTYSTQTGYYTRIGRQVFFTIRVILTAKDAAMAGNIYITLPSTLTPTSNGSLNGGYINYCQYVSWTSGKWASVYVPSGSARIKLMEYGTNVAATAVTASQIQNNTDLMISGVYFI